MKNNVRNINIGISIPTTELEWDFYSPEEPLDNRVSRSLGEMQNDMKKIVRAYFLHDEHPYHALDMVSRYQEIYYGVTLLFKNYKKCFETLLREQFSEEKSAEQIQVEAMVFCAWLSLEIMTEFSLR